MKTASTILSWIGGILTTVIGLTFLSIGRTSTTHYHSYYGDDYTLTEQVPYPVWIWLLYLANVVARIIILIWRQYSISNGRKIACGICTILFASVLGGIFTLCIPEKDLYSDSKNSYSTRYVSINEQTSDYNYGPVDEEHPLEIGAQIKVINEYEDILEQRRIPAGTIGKIVAIQGNAVFFNVNTGSSNFETKTTKENVCAQKRQLTGNANKHNIDKFEEITKYKALLDQGIITQEEFEAKKKELNI